MTRTVANASGCSAELTLPWWEKERTYLCEGERVFEFTDAEERLASIEETVSFAGGTLAYADRRRGADGDWVVEAGSIEVDLAPGAGTCELACKTRRPRENTQVGLTGHVAEERLGTEGYDLLYRTCTPEGSCPAGPGEEVLIPCQCIDEFAEAATILLTLKAAQEDLVCSDGVAK